MFDVDVNNMSSKDVDDAIKSIANTFIYRSKLKGVVLSKRKLDLMVAIFLKKYFRGDINNRVEAKWLVVKVPILIQDCIESVIYEGLSLNIYASDYEYNPKGRSFYGFTWSPLKSYSYVLVDEIINVYIGKTYLWSVLKYKYFM